MKLLLTGGTGYIGSHAAVSFHQAGHEIYILDNLTNSKESVLEKLKSITGKDFPFFCSDLRDNRSLVNYLKTNKIECVIHFAGKKAVGESVDNPLVYYDNNLYGTISLLKAMKTCEIKKLVFSSSATVYGKPSYLPIDELHPTQATSPYGSTKLQIENILNDLHYSDPEWNIISLRYFNPIGSHESSLIGESPEGVPNNLMPYIVRVANKEYPILKVFGDDFDTIDGTGVRDYIHVMDLVEGHLSAFDFMNNKDKKNNKGFNIFNLGTGKGFSVLELVKTFMRVTNCDIPFEIVARRRGDVDSLYADSGKAFRKLNWKASRSIEEMCETSWKYNNN